MLLKIVLALTACIAMCAPASATWVLRLGVIGSLKGAHSDLSLPSARYMAGLAVRGLTYFDGSVGMACLMCEQLPTKNNGASLTASTNMVGSCKPYGSAYAAMPNGTTERRPPQGTSLRLGCRPRAR
jgi:hypothetical protein